MALNVRYPGIFSKTVILAIGICLMMLGTPVAALPLSNSISGNYHGLSYGYSINLQSTTGYPVFDTSESQGLSVTLFSPALAGHAYRRNYLTGNSGSTQALFTKLKNGYFVNPQKSLPVPPEYLQPFPSPENLHIVTSIDYVDVTNQWIHTES
jgi:hypothetical protein